MSQRFERVLYSVLVASAAAIAVAVIKREFFATTGPIVRPEKDPEFVASWGDALPIALSSGRDDAPVKVVEFVDFECPVCAHYHPTLREVAATRADRASLLYVHVPLTQHRFALAAARAVECADSMHHLEGFVDVVFEKQDSLGLKTWASYAQDSGVSDTVSFRQCMTSDPPPARIAAGSALAKKLGVKGTPTLMVNGWMLEGGGYSAAQLIALVDALADGRLGPGSSTKSVKAVLR